MLILGTKCFGDDISASNILEKAAVTYKSMKTYRAEGTITSDVDIGGTQMSLETSFSVLLQKPNLYLISWTQKNIPMSGMAQSGAVWSDGTQPYLYMGIMNAYSKMTNDEFALSSATGISGGAAFTTPSLFLSVFTNQPNPFSRLNDPKIEQSEKVGEEDCYVLCGPSSISKKETLWISKTTYLIRKYCWSLESPEGGRQMPKMNDEQLEAAIKGMGQEVTDESKKNMRDMMERSAETLKTAKMKGSSTELYADVSSPKLNKNDFNFAVPEGTVLKESLFSGMFNGTNSMSNKRSDGAVTGSRYDKAIASLDAAKTEMERFYALDAAAKEALNEGKKDEAKKYADELNTLMVKYPKDWNYGNAIEDVNIVFGRLALSEGKIEEAKGRLLEAGKSPGSPQMNSFGPNMTLARELLKKGEKDAVLKYFELCAKFWKMDFGKLKEWRSQVEKGETPDFGANLLY